jgi:hypothetical protein
MASTLTTKGKLFKPTAGTNEPFRIADVNGNWDKIDQQLGTFVCTSTTRPATPFTGQVIFETDTLRQWVWTGTRWFFIGGRNFNVGVQRTTNGGGLTANTWTSITWNDALDSETTDAAMWNGSGQLIALIDGIYRADLSVRFEDNNSAGNYECGIQKQASATNMRRGTYLKAGTAPEGKDMVAWGVFGLAAGEWLNGAVRSSIAASFVESLSSSSYVSPTMNMTLVAAT